MENLLVFTAILNFAVPIPQWDDHPALPVLQKSVTTEQQQTLSKAGVAIFDTCCRDLQHSGIKFAGNHALHPINRFGMNL